MPQQEEKQRVPKLLDEGGRSVINVINPIVMDEANILSLDYHCELTPAAVVANRKQVCSQFVHAILWIQPPKPVVKLLSPEAGKRCFFAVQFCKYPTISNSMSITLHLILLHDEARYTERFQNIGLTFSSPCKNHLYQKGHIHPTTTP